MMAYMQFMKAFCQTVSGEHDIRNYKLSLFNDLKCVGFTMWHCGTVVKTNLITP